MVIDYSHGLAADTLSRILNRLDVDVVPLNARMDETKLAMLQVELPDQSPAHRHHCRRAGARTSACNSMSAARSSSSLMSKANAWTT